MGTAHPGRLVISASPGEDESLRSYVDRLAERNAMPVGEMLKTLGLMGTGDRAPGFGVALTACRQRRLRALTGLEEGEVQAMLLGRLHGVCLDLGPQGAQITAGAAERRIALLASSQWALSTRSLACRACLQADGHWRVSWRLAWSFMCPRHNCLLESTCPGCGLALCSGRPSQPSAIATVLSAVPVTGRCANQPAGGVVGAGGRVACGQGLAGRPHRLVRADSPLVDLQRRLDRELGGPPGPEVLARFRSRRELVVGLLEHGPMELEQDGLPAAVRDAWGAHAAERVARRAAGEPAPTRRALAHAPAPGDPALMAGALLLADGALERPSPQRPCDRFDPARVQALVGIDLGRARRSDRAKSGSSTGADARSAQVELDARWVPRVLPAALAEPLAGLVVGGVRGDAQRSGLSVLVLQRAQGGTLTEAASWLGHDEPVLARMRAQALRRRVAADRRSDFERRLEQIAGVLAEEAIDYRQRERALAELSLVPASVLAATLRPASGGRGERMSPVRRRHLAAWLWSQLVGASALEAPAFPEGMNEHERTVQRRTTLWLDEQRRELLLAWGGWQLSADEA